MYDNFRIYVLNLIITGIPSILRNSKFLTNKVIVLNLIITGIPSILKILGGDKEWKMEF